LILKISINQERDLLRKISLFLFAGTIFYIQDWVLQLPGSMGRLLKETESRG